MTKLIENKLRQSVPVLIKDTVSGELFLYIMKDREVFYIEDDAVSQDLIDKGNVNLISISQAGEGEGEPIGQ